MSNVLEFIYYKFWNCLTYKKIMKEIESLPQTLTNLMSHLTLDISNYEICFKYNRRVHWCTPSDYIECVAKIKFSILKNSF